jgi:tetratricopeptide (TPR) repeat protein
LNFFKNLFKRKSHVKTDRGTAQVVDFEAQAESKIEPEVTSADKEDLIKVYDEFGREVFISRDQWVDGVLLGKIKDSWEIPQELYNTILMAVNDGFHEHVVDAAKQLFEIDSNKERGACMCAIVLMKNKLLVDAEAILKRALKLVPDSGVLMTNLAKVYADQKLHEQSEAILLRGLELDPNQDNGLSWYLAIANERGGKEAYHNALLKVAEYSGSWRPQLWLARTCLEAGDKDQALNYYDLCLSVNTQPSDDLLRQISGDLGINGHIAEIVAIVSPVYNIEQHGYQVGNNLIKAFIELERYQEAKALVESLFALNRLDWKDGLSYWDNELDLKIKNYGPVEVKDTPVIKTNVLSPPCWLYGNDKRDDLFDDKPETAYRVVTISASCTRHDKSNDQLEKDMPRVTRTDMEGSLCRGFPLSLCDSLNLNSTCSATMLVPSIEGGGLVFITKEHSADDALYLSEKFPCDLIILPHLITGDEYWVMRLKLYKSGESETVAILSTTFTPDNPEMKLAELSLKLKQYIQFHNDVQPQASSTQLEQLAVDRYGHYIDANSSCLSLLIAANDEHGADTLYGERNIFDKLLGLAVDEKGSHVFKLMFIWALVKNKGYGSEIYKEYDKKVKHFMERVECPDEIRAVLEGEVGKLGLVYQPCN